MNEVRESMNESRDVLSRFQMRDSFAQLRNTASVILSPVVQPKRQGRKRRYKCWARDDFPGKYSFLKQLNEKINQQDPALMKLLQRYDIDDCQDFLQICKFTREQDWSRNNPLFEMTFKMGFYYRHHFSEYFSVPDPNDVQDFLANTLRFRNPDIPDFKENCAKVFVYISKLSQNLDADK